MNNLCAILLRFRTHAFALSTDIEKAFLHVKLHPSDRNFTRFLWPSDLQSSDNELRTYRFTVVPIGASSSPFMLGAVLNLHLSRIPNPIAERTRHRHRHRHTHTHTHIHTHKHIHTNTYTDKQTQTHTDTCTIHTQYKLICTSLMSICAAVAMVENDIVLL